MRRVPHRTFADVGIPLDEELRSGEPPDRHGHLRCRARAVAVTIAAASTVAHAGAARRRTRCPTAPPSLTGSWPAAPWPSDGASRRRRRSPHRRGARRGRHRRHRADAQRAGGRGPARHRGARTARLTTLGVLVGAGTVLSVAAARRAVDAGARFIVIARDRPERHRLVRFPRRSELPWRPDAERDPRRPGAPGPAP